MTVLTGLSNERKLAGLAVLSGWTPMRNTLKSVNILFTFLCTSLTIKYLQMMTDYAKQIPIFWGHGMQDPLVRFDIAQASRDFLKAQGVPIASEIGGKGLSFNAYPGVQHSTNMQELEDLTTFIKKVIPPTE
jgi:predicted esterase